jgi:hypothetical protein
MIMKRYFLSKPKKVVSVFLLLTLLSFSQGCKYFYKIKTVNNVTPKEIVKYDSLNKYLILHQRLSAWHLSEVSIKDNLISGHLSELESNHLKYQTVKTKKAYRYKKSTEFYILDEVHLYLQDSLLPKFQTGDNIKIDLSAIKRAEIYQRAKGRTTVSWVIPMITVPIAVAAVAGTIVLLTKSSCPLVYIKNDNKVEFAGEIFGGAVYSSLERHDYLPLPGFKPSKGRYELLISNGLPEIQYINLAELIIVNHQMNTSVLTDRQGVVHTINQPEAPEEASTTSNSDILSLVNEKDQQCFLFDEEPSVTGDTCAFNTAFLTFRAPDQVGAGKLIIKAGNSLWGDYTYGEFTKLFGYNYGAWIKKQGKEPPEKNSRWKLDQRFALLVYLETKTGWQFVDYFDLIGPLGAREMIMPVDLSQALIKSSTDSERLIRIKLESGFKFWDLDYAAMDFTTDTPFAIDFVKPTSATTETGIDVTNGLTENDSRYYIQENIGEEALVIFKDSPEIRGKKKSVFLHTKGYYEHVRNYPNPPDKKQLETFLIPGRFSKFSFENYTTFIKNNSVFAEDPIMP